MLRSASLVALCLAASLGIAEAKGGAKVRGVGTGGSVAPATAAAPAGKAGDVKQSQQSDGRFARDPGAGAQPVGNLMSAEAARPKPPCDGRPKVGGFCLIN